MTLEVSKLEIFIDSKFEQLWNILCISKALLVSKFDKSR